MRSAIEWTAVRAGGGLPSGRRFGRRPILADSGLSHMGGVLSYSFRCLSYGFVFLSYVFRIVSYGFRLLSYEPTLPQALTKRKVHSIGKQSAVIADCPVGGASAAARSWPIVG